VTVAGTDGHARRTTFRGRSTDHHHLVLMLVLTFSTGVVDAVGYLGFDRVFTGNMTGNVVILGMGLAGADGLPVLRPVLALVFFILGAAVAGRGLAGAGPGWSRSTTAALAVVTGCCAALAVFVAVVEVHDKEIYGTITTSTLAFVMGVQAAVARSLKVAEITTVVVTSTITGLASEFGLGAGQNPYWLRRILAILLILLGALVGAATLHLNTWSGITLTAVLMASVTVAGHRRHRFDREDRLRPPLPAGDHT